MDQSRGLNTGTLVLLLRAALCYNSDVLQDLRLAGGDGSCEGRVEVNIHGEWGTVCDDAWSAKNTEVVCRQLGCPQAPTHSVKASSFGAGNGKVWLTDVTCSGEETSLKDCKYFIEEGDICDYRNDVGVICSGEAEKLRLVGGGSECEGRVEVKHRGEWGTVCGVNWSRQEAAVVCRQLGCNFTNIVQVRAASFGAGSGRIWLSQVKCVWDEPELWACQHRMWGSGRCKHQDDAGVICSAAPAELRLVGGDSECEGRLEVKHQGEWGTVCGESWQEKEAAVVCRQLGCSSSHDEAVLVQAISFGPGSEKIWLSDVACAGQESDLWQCKHQMWGNPFCQHKQDVGVICAAGHLHAGSHHCPAEASRHFALLGDREKSAGPQILDRHLPPGFGDHYTRDLFCHHSSPAEGLHEEKATIMQNVLFRLKADDMSRQTRETQSCHSSRSNRNMGELPRNVFPVIVYPFENVIITVHTEHFTSASINLSQFSRH